LDGSLGVIYGLEIARTLEESARLRAIGVDVVSFEDEEGTYLAEYGCRTFCGEDVSDEAAGARNQAGESLLSAVAASGVADNPPARLDRARHVAYLEAHIEQGPRLEAERLQIGVVTGIVGMRTYRIVIGGRADHAGTTPMGMRCDAGAAAFSFGARIVEAFRDSGSVDSVWNIGNAVFKPGAANVVPSEVQLALQFRDPSLDVLDRFERIAEQLLKEAGDAFSATTEFTRVLNILPTPMDDRIIRVIEQAATDAGAKHTRMPSGAGHDAMIVARYVPTGMLFVPSIGGRSHHVSENTSDADIVAGANVLLRSACALCECAQ
jgi:N-carbamoyl-L-amino-acid hydrolase